MPSELPPNEFQNQVLSELRQINTRLDKLEADVKRVEMDVKKVEMYGRVGLLFRPEESTERENRCRYCFNL